MAYYVGRGAYPKFIIKSDEKPIDLCERGALAKEINKLKDLSIHLNMERGVGSEKEKLSHSIQSSPLKAVVASSE
jgi:hypothetical protein